jgi:hypothetical protein
LAVRRSVFGIAAAGAPVVQLYVVVWRPQRSRRSCPDHGGERAVGDEVRGRLWSLLTEWAEGIMRNLPLRQVVRREALSPEQ